MCWILGPGWGLHCHRAATASLFARWRPRFSERPEEVNNALGSVFRGHSATTLANPFLDAADEKTSGALGQATAGLGEFTTAAAERPQGG